MGDRGVVMTAHVKRFRLTWSWGDITGQPLATSVVEARNLRMAKAAAFLFAKGRGPGFLVVLDENGTRLASRRFHRTTSSGWQTTFSGGAL